LAASPSDPGHIRSLPQFLLAATSETGGEGVEDDRGEPSILVGEADDCEVFAVGDGDVDTQK